ncbi:MAG: hypothetical protein AABY83_07570 [Pseudomonadota bacterium]
MAIYKILATAGWWLSLAASSAAYAGGIAEIPRSLGPFKLRMSIGEFAQIAHVQPEPCANCAKNEVFTALSAAQVRQLIPKLNTNAGLDLIFYENRLYRISLGTEATDLSEVRKELSALYGTGQTVALKNGTSYMQWEDSGTIVTANYQTASEQVFAINYFDWDIKTERDNRASLDAGQADTR